MNRLTILIITALFTMLACPSGFAAEKAHSTAAAASDSKQTEAPPKPADEGTEKDPDDNLVKDAEKVEGLIPLYRKDNKLYAELCPSHYSNEYLVLIAIARGIGRDPLLGGMTWSNGDDWVWSFRKVDKRVLVIRKNVRFRADKGTPAATAVKYAYTDSVLFSLPIAGTGPDGGDLVDLTQVFMSDLPQITQVLRGFFFSAAKSTWGEVKGFSDNAEIEVAATYSSGGTDSFDSVPDSRGVTLHVRYSISRIPKNGYDTRLADDRVGYFLTVVKDYSKKGAQDRFVRYINRWNLQPADPSSQLSPPKKPIVFWMENTIPFKYRAAVRDGILEWNKAFEKAGFVDAIEVRQQPDKADWDAADINYNTFRWITSSAGYAMGPSRVNPYTGEILDADIIFDADFLRFWRRKFETLTPKSIATLTGGALDLDQYRAEETSLAAQHGYTGYCMRQQAMARQLAFGSSVAAIALEPADYDAAEEKLIMQGLKATVMHEVGHTLGLRHNFKGSTFRSLDVINQPELVRENGMLASVMDYDAVNIVPPGEEQGDYYTTTIGPYDMWAIEYGYKPVSGDEAGELAAIAARSGRAELAYASDQDTRGIDPDPYANRWDLGSDPLEFAKRQATVVSKLLPDVVERMTNEGDDYTQARRAFNVLLSTHGQAMYFVSRFIGGVKTSRSHRGDVDAAAPLEVVPAERQREALQMLSEHVFSDTPFQVPTEVYRHLVPSRWRHWGTSTPHRVDYPVHDVILMWQSRVLDKLLSSLTLERLHDTELQVDASLDCMTTAELLEQLTETIFSELDGLDDADAKFTNRLPAISSLRRNLQRTYLKQLGQLALGQTSAPEDCQTVAFVLLQELVEQVDEALAAEHELDRYSQAHLVETAHQIRKVLEARVMQLRI